MSNFHPLEVVFQVGENLNHDFPLPMKIFFKFHVIKVMWSIVWTLLILRSHAGFTD